MTTPAATCETAPLLLTPAEAAELLSICPKTLWARTAPRGRIPCVRLGKCVRYSRMTLEAWIRQEENRTQLTEETSHGPNQEV